MMSRLLPLFAFIVLVALLAFGIQWNKHHEMTEVPSPLIDKKAPEFTFHFYTMPTKSSVAAIQASYILNVFGSWCPTCQYEHPILTQVLKPLGIKLIGLDWRDDPADAQRWLKQFEILMTR